ncbi:MAG: molybdenum cofactor biosynthesis protein MoaE [Candidatus Methylacidiphilales bacterium]|nr:molybdenum cofactor biosynthesis protein MoaE [Candidatus Methylacidiphilales bacterium]
MKINVILTRQPVHSFAPGAPGSDTENGAFLDFFGVVRGTELKKKIAGIDYSAYEKMAEKELHRIIAELAKSHPVAEVTLIHRLGFVSAGEASLLVRVASAHRAEALAMMDRLITEMKRDVPIWKKVVSFNTQNTVNTPTL